jgi:hypothetical protein
MGAAGRCEVRSEAVTVPGLESLTCRNVLQQRLCRVARSVRIEGVRGSNPLSSTQVKGRFTVKEPAFLIFRQQQTAATVTRASHQACGARPGWPVRVKSNETQVSAVS